MSERTHVEITSDAIALLDEVARGGGMAGERGHEGSVSVQQISRLIGLLNEMFQLGIDV
jgi:hypothetical protein